MILTLMVWVFVFQCMMVCLSYRESVLPTILRQILRNSVDVVPLWLCQSGVFDFTIETVPLHHHRVFDSDITSTKSGKDFQYQIWDPGIVNFGFEALPLSLYYIPEKDVMVSCNTMIRTATEGLNFMERLICISDRDKLSMVHEKRMGQRKEFSSQCFVHNPIRRWLDVLPLHHPGLNVNFQNDESEDEFYLLLNIGIALTLTGWPLDVMDWVLAYLGSKVDSMDVTSDFKESMWVIRQRRLHNDHSTIGRAYPGATSLFYVMWSFNARMPERHTYHIRVRWILKKEYIMFYNMIASKAYRQEASSNSLFQLCPLQHMVHKFAYVKVCFGEFLYGLNTVVILFI